MEADGLGRGDVNGRLDPLSLLIDMRDDDGALYRR